METSAVIKTLRKQEVKEINVMKLEDIYKENAATIKLSKFSKKIPIQKRVRQGNTISPKLFMAVLEEVFKNLE